MRILYSFQDISPEIQNGAVSIGNFDGVHRGHARILERLTSWATNVRGPSVVLTFHPHPLALLRPEQVPTPLATLERKLELLAATRVDAVIVYPTDSALLNLSAEAFFQQILQTQLRCRAIVEGPNFNFGRGRAGNIATLQTLAQSAQIHVEIVPPLEAEGTLISSSRVRDVIQAGRIGLANSWLTAPYRLTGRVVTGVARGRTIGFPTANLSDVQTIVPKLGVYMGRTRIEDRAWPCAIHLGPNPTFGEEAVKIEVHVIGFTGDLYGRVLDIDFLDRLRDIQKFGSPNELIDQLRRDVAEASEACRCGGWVD